jgi:hypothetical protein
LTIAWKYFEREYEPSPGEPSTEDLLNIEGAGQLSETDAKLLMGRLSSYFAKKSAEKLPEEARVARAKTAANARWNKDRKQGDRQ